MDKWGTNVNLKKHAYSVEAAMRTYVIKRGGDPAVD